MRVVILRDMVVNLTVVIQRLQISLPFSYDVKLEITHTHILIRGLKVKFELQTSHVLFIAEPWTV